MEARIVMQVNFLRYRRVAAYQDIGGFVWNFY
jgi:hypothetical protein